MSAPQYKVHFDTSAPAPPSYSPPPSYAAHSFSDGIMTFTQKERMASIAENKLGYLVSQKRREPSLRKVLLHAGFLERLLDSIDASTPESIEAEPMIEEDYQQVEMKGSFVPEPAYEIHQSLSTIIEDDEMEVDEEEEDMAPLERTISHRPGSPASDNERRRISPTSRMRICLPHHLNTTPLPIILSSICLKSGKRHDGKTYQIIIGSNTTIHHICSL